MGFDNIHREFPPNGPISLGNSEVSSTGVAECHMEFTSATTTMKFRTFLARIAALYPLSAATTYYGPYDIVSGTCRGYSRTKNTNYTRQHAGDGVGNATEKRCGYYDSSPTGTALATTYDKYPFSWFNRHGYNKNHSDFNYTIGSTNFNRMEHGGVARGEYGGVPPTCGIDFGNGNNTIGSLKSGTDSSWSVTNGDVIIDQVLWMKNTATDTRGLTDLEGIIMLSFFVDHDNLSTQAYIDAAYVEINGQFFKLNTAAGMMQGMNNFAADGGGPQNFDGSTITYTFGTGTTTNQVLVNSMQAYMIICTDEQINALNAYSDNATHDYIKVYTSSQGPVKYNRGLHEHLDKSTTDANFTDLKLHTSSASNLYGDKTIAGSSAIGTYSGNGLYHGLKLIAEATNPDILLNTESGQMQLSDYYGLPIPRYATRLDIGIVRTTSICMKSCSYSYYYGYSKSASNGGDSTEETFSYLSNQDTWDQEGNSIELEYIELGFGSFAFATYADKLQFSNASSSEKNRFGPRLGLNHMYLIDEVEDQVIKKYRLVPESPSSSGDTGGNICFNFIDESADHSAIGLVTDYTNIKDYYDNSRKLLVVIC